MLGAIPFLFPAQAQEEVSSAPTEKTINPWLDDYSAPVGFTYGANVTLNSSYLWRGIYAGALNIQPSANVGYGGLYLDMWWNIGVADWSFKTFQPELDLTIGFSRWGLNACVMFIHNFNCGFFDFSNYPDKGNRLEARLRYTVSSKLPISFLWATRIAAADGYLNASGDTLRAYSTYIELSYTHHFPYDISLYGAIGVTPWTSFYTNYEGKFAVANIELRLTKDWSLSEHCGLALHGTMSINPWAIANDRTTVEWHPTQPWNQSINANLGATVYLK